MLVDKYSPKSLSDFVGNRSSVDSALELVKTNHPVVLVGKTGVGKTSLAFLIAKELDFSLFELNASDYRTKKEVLSLKSLLSQKSLFGKSKLLLIDDIDALSASDRGCISGVVALLKEYKNIIITANDLSDRKFKDITKLAKVVYLMPLSADEIFERLKFIAESEHISVDDSLLRIIALRNNGDLRAAINDLEAVSGDSDYSVMVRDVELNIQETLQKLFSSQRFSEARHVFDNSELSYDAAIQWIERNIPFNDITNARRMLMWLSKADIYLALINRLQYWRFLVYYFSYLSFSGLEFKGSKKKISSPNIALLKWIGNNATRIRNSIVDKISSKLLISSDAVNECFSIFNEIFIKSDCFYDFELDDKEIEYVKSHAMVKL